MTFWDDFKKNTYKFSEAFINKTEDYARITKLTMDIKKHELSQKKLTQEIGDFVVSQLNSGVETIKLSEPFIQTKVNEIISINKNIENCNNEIAQLKKGSKQNS